MAVDEEVEASEDAFSDAFNEFVEGGDEPTGDELTDEPEGDDPDTDEEPEGDEPKGDDSDNTDDDEPEGDEPEEKEDDDSEGEDPEDAGGKPAAKTADELQVELDALTHKHSTLQGMYNSEVRKKRDADPKSEGTDGDEPEPTDKDEEASSFKLEGLTELPAFKELNEELGKAATTALADGLGHVAQSVVEQVTKAFETRMSGIEGKIQPISEEHTQSATKKHFAAINEKHPDRVEIIESGDIQAWMESQPEYKKKMYMEVFEKGSAEEVIDLFDTYKEATGKVTAPPASDDKGNKTRKKSANKDEDLEALETVDTRGAPISTGRGEPSKDDFAGAWAEAIKS